MTPTSIETWYIIANPTAGNNTVGKSLDSIVDALKIKGVKFELVKTEYADHAIALVEKAIRLGFRKIMAIGGDGTNNEVINGIFFQNLVPAQEITYCLLPVGTGNDWIKHYKIPKNLPAWLEMLKAEKTFVQDIGLVHYTKSGKRHKRYFANVAGMSYDAFVLAEMKKLKRPVTNRLAYLIYGLYYIFEFNIPKARVYFNGKMVDGYFYLINSGICKYSGGGMQLVPHAISNDGEMALTLAGKLTKIGVLLNSYRFYNGRISGHSKVDIFQTKKIKVEAVDQPILVEADGELLGETPVEFSIIPQALKLVVP